MSDISLIGYFDQSGSPSDTPWTTLAGYVAPAPVWDWFNGLWLSVLSESGLSYLHMKDHPAPGILAALNNRCLGPAREKGLYGVACAIDNAEYQRAKEDLPQLPPFEEVCAGVIANVAIRRILPEDRATAPQVYLYFDRGEDYCLALKRAWEADRANDQPKSWGTFLFEPRQRNSKESPGLQAADYIAWNVNRWLTKRAESRSRVSRDFEVEWDSIRAALRISSVGGYIDEVGYEKLMRWYERPSSAES